MATFDVLIAGAGPAGAATAIALARIAPDLRVCLVDAPPGPRPPLGEVLAPVVRPILDQLGLWSAFEDQAHAPSHRAYSAWGASDMVVQEFMLEARGPAWRVDRAGFDHWLAGCARSQVKATVEGKVVALQRDASGWTANCGAAGALTADFVIDATGRSAALARMVGLAHRGEDRLTAYALHLEATEGGVPELVVEAVCEGWWYTAALPGGRRVVVCLTDPDIARAKGLRTTEGWFRALSETRHVADVVGAARSEQAPAVWPAGGRKVVVPTDQPLLCVGDAAACFDPICAVGASKAMRSGLFAAYAVADRLLRADPASLRRYWDVADSEHRGYARGLAQIYQQEERWPDSAFWARRRGSEPQRLDGERRT